MFLKNLKQTLTLILLTIIIIPTNILAYSKSIIVGGENIGLSLKTDGIVIVGTYEIDGIKIAEKAGLKKGDIIKMINDKSVVSIDEMVDEINKNENLNVKIGYYRDDIFSNTNLKLVKKNNIYKTGLYVKDSISGIGTLTYVDPNTKMYGALGHEITESNSGVRLEVKSGKIYDSNVTSIDKATSGNPGSKNATLDTTMVNGDILKNTESGIFGNYTRELKNEKKYKVASPSDIKKGNAKILTVLDGKEVGSYDIKILKINLNENSKIKKILFEVTDSELLNKTGGIVQGMSGSPIIQDDYIIGAVTSVVVSSPKNGYGILITDMLEEMEKES